jgi:hypothetical protein
MQVKNIEYGTRWVKVPFSTLNMQSLNREFYVFPNVSYCKNCINKALLSKNCATFPLDAVDKLNV